MSAEMWRGLAGEVEAAPRWDRKLDGRVHAVACPPLSWDFETPADVFIRYDDDGHGVFKIDPGVPSSVACEVPAYTASVDAVLALIAETLPGWTPFFKGGDPTRRDPDLKLAYGRVEPHLGNDDGWAIGCRDAFAATPALALLAATCRAKAAQAEGGRSS